MSVERCKCSHSKRSHVGQWDNDKCCAVWQVKEDKENLGSLLRFCEGIQFEKAIEVKNE